MFSTLSNHITVYKWQKISVSFVDTGRVHSSSGLWDFLIVQLAV